MDNLTAQRCFHHGLREAVARCPECGRFFCRECITEHEDRVLCNDCIAKIAAPSRPLTARFPWIRKAAQLGAGLIVAWIFFYYVGQILVSIPTDFHDGTIWQHGWWTVNR